MNTALAISPQRYRAGVNSAPNGIALNATYVSYLRRILSGSTRFRMTGDLQPVVIVADGKAVGVLMPVKK